MRSLGDRRQVVFGRCALGVALALIAGCGVSSPLGVDAYDAQPQDTTEYRARQYIGGIERISVTGASRTLALCVELVFADSEAPKFNVIAPAPWRMTSATVYRSQTCRTSEYLDALSAAGSLSLPPGKRCPVDVDVTVTFPTGRPAWAPAEIVLKVSNLAVEGCS